MFDQVLLGDSASEDAFHVMLSRTSPNAIVRLLEGIQYPRMDAIIEKAIAYNMSQFTTKRPSVSFAWGCRKPDSQRGHADGVFVVAKPRGGYCCGSDGCNDVEITSALLQHGVDNITHPETDQHAAAMYWEYIGRGWTKMDAQDLMETVGINVDDDTSLEPLSDLK